MSPPCLSIPVSSQLLQRLICEIALEIELSFISLIFVIYWNYCTVLTRLSDSACPLSNYSLYCLQNYVSKTESSLCHLKATMTHTAYQMKTRLLSIAQCG